jgi:hypothetical protein
VSRKAKALVFGFQAMTFLKTENISYAVKKDEYLKYFRCAGFPARVHHGLTSHFQLPDACVKHMHLASVLLPQPQA